MLLNGFDLLAQRFGFLELFFLAVLLKKRGVAEPDVLDFACELVFPFSHVHFVWLPNNALPMSFGTGCIRR